MLTILIHRGLLGYRIEGACVEWDQFVCQHSLHIGHGDITLIMTVGNKPCINIGVIVPERPMYILSLKHCIQHHVAHM